MSFDHYPFNKKLTSVRECACVLPTPMSFYLQCEKSQPIASTSYAFSTHKNTKTVFLAGKWATLKLITGSLQQRMYIILPKYQVGMNFLRGNLTRLYGQVMVGIFPSCTLFLMSVRLK